MTFTWKQWLRERASVLGYRYIACLFVILLATWYIGTQMLDFVVVVMLLIGGCVECCMLFCVMCVIVLHCVILYCIVLSCPAL